MAIMILADARTHRVRAVAFFAFGTVITVPVRRVVFLTLRRRRW